MNDTREVCGRAMDRSEACGSAYQNQPPISDYAYISDCHSCALVSSSGSIDWCCMPRIAVASCFGRILDGTMGVVARSLHRILMRATSDTWEIRSFSLTDRDQANVIASLVGRSLGFKRVVTASSHLLMRGRSSARAMKS
jgi:hypothetical protein